LEVIFQGAYFLCGNLPLKGNVPRKNKGQLMVGLVIAQPERTKELLLIFMEIAKSHANVFRLDLMMMQIADVIGTDELQNILNEIGRKM